MSSAGRTEEPAESLVGWKRIAAYFGRDESTVKRWESTRNLPVRRLPGARGAVYALPAELAAWREGDERLEAPTAPAAFPVSAPAAPIAPRRRRSLVLAGGLAGVIVAVVACVTIVGFQARSEGAPVPPDPKARELFLEGRLALEQRTPASLSRSMAAFSGAIAQDPRYAAAYSGLAESWLLIREYGAVPDAQAYPRAQAAARAALALDPKDAAGERALGFVRFWWRHDLIGAKRHMTRALALAPNDPQTLHWLANIESEAGEHEAAIAHIDRARALDPASPSIAADRGLALAYAYADPAAGLAALREVLATQPANQSAQQRLMRFALAAGRDQEFLERASIVGRLTGDAKWLERVARYDDAYREGGRAALRAAVLGDARSAGDRIMEAELLALDGRRAEAMSALREETAQPHLGGPGIGVDPYLVSLRSEPGFAELAAHALQETSPDT